MPASLVVAKRIRAAAFTALALAACKEGGTNEASGTSSVNAASKGIFVPLVVDASAAYARAAKRISDPNTLAATLGLKLTARDVGAGIKGEFRVATTDDGENILIQRDGLTGPQPVASIAADGTKYVWSYIKRQTTDKSASVNLNLWLKHQGNEVPKVKNSPDGGDSSLYLLHQAVNSEGVTEPTLVSWANHIRGPDGRFIYRVGNVVLDAKTGLGVLEYREIGTQAWQTIGVYNDGVVSTGTGIWTPDNQVFYTLAPGATQVAEWTKQDANFMSFHAMVPLASLKVPAVVKAAVDTAAAAPALALAGGKRQLDHRRVGIDYTRQYHGSVTLLQYDGATSGAAGPPHPAGLALGGYGPTPDSDDFYEFPWRRQSESGGFGLGGGVNYLSPAQAQATGLPTFNPRNQYPAGSQFVYPMGGGQYAVGTAIAPSRTETTSGGSWPWSADVRTNITTVGIPGASTAQVVRSNGSDPPDITYQNRYDLQQKAEGLSSTQKDTIRQNEADFQSGFAKANITTAEAGKTADAIEHKLTTVDGLAGVAIDAGVSAAGANNGPNQKLVESFTQGPVQNGAVHQLTNLGTAWAGGLATSGIQGQGKEDVVSNHLGVDAGGVASALTGNNFWAGNAANFAVTNLAGAAQGNAPSGRSLVVGGLETVMTTVGQNAGPGGAIIASEAKLVLEEANAIQHNVQAAMEQKAAGTFADKANNLRQVGTEAPYLKAFLDSGGLPEAPPAERSPGERPPGEVPPEVKPPETPPVEGAPVLGETKPPEGELGAKPPEPVRPEDPKPVEEPKAPENPAPEVKPPEPAPP